MLETVLLGDLDSTMNGYKRVGPIKHKHVSSVCVGPVAVTWRRVWGDGNFFSRTKISEWRFFRKKFPFSHPKILTFLVIDQIFQNFPFFLQILRIFTLLNVVYDPSFTHKKTHYVRKEFLDDTFFTLFVLSRVRDNTTSQNIGGTDAWAVPTSNFFGGGPSPSPPRYPPLCRPSIVYIFVALPCASLAHVFRVTPISAALTYFFNLSTYLGPIDIILFVAT